MRGIKRECLAEMIGLEFTGLSHLVGKSTSSGISVCKGANLTVRSYCMVIANNFSLETVITCLNCSYFSWF